MPLKQTLTAAAVMLLTSACLAYLTNSDDQPIKKNLSDFPMQIGDWQGTKSRFDDKVYESLGVDDSILATYRNQHGENIQLYVGYYANQRKGELIHSPKNCMPGSGWNIIETSLIPLGLTDQNEEPIKVIKLELQNGIQRQVVLYWFHSRGRVIASEYSQKIYLVWDSITKHRTDGSFIRLLSPVSDNGEHKATESLKRFTELIFPILNEFIPT